MSRDIPLSLIDPDPEQPRKYFDPAALEELAQSMQANGLAVPVLLRPHDGRFTIVHGERRCRAAALLSWEAIPANVEEMTPERARMLALIENVQRNDLSPIEEARAYADMLAGGLTQTALGAQIGKSQSYIAGKLRLLKMPAALQLLLDRGALTEGHVKQLLRLDKFYDGARLDIVPDQPPVDWPAVYDDPPCYIMGYMISARPLDKWIGGAFVVEDHPRNITALDAIRLQDATWRPANDLQPLAWQFTALWFALFTYYEGLPVTDLKQAIDTFMSYVVNAAVWLHTHPLKPLPGVSGKIPDYEREHYYGAQSDLRHAGLEAWADSNTAGCNLYLNGTIADKRLFNFDSWLLPTNMQYEITNNPNGPVAKRYHYLERHTDYYD